MMRNTLLVSLLAITLPTLSLHAQEDAKPQTPPIKAEMKKFDKALDEVKVDVGVSHRNPQRPTHARHEPGLLAVDKVLGRQVRNRKRR